MMGNRLEREGIMVATSRLMDYLTSEESVSGWKFLDEPTKQAITKAFGAGLSAGYDSYITRSPPMTPLQATVAATWMMGSTPRKEVVAAFAKLKADPHASRDLLEVANAVLLADQDTNWVYRNIAPGRFDKTVRDLADKAQAQSTEEYETKHGLTFAGNGLAARTYKKAFNN